MSALVPWMATANAFHGQPAPREGAVRSDGFQGVSRAARRVAAPRQRAEQKSLGRRNRPAIDAHRKNQNVLGQIHSVLYSALAVPRSVLNNPARRNVVKKSFSTSVKLRPAIEGRATRTRSTDCANSC